MKHILLLILIILSTKISHSQWTSDTTINTIVRDTAGATAPLTASGPDGSTYISWFEFGGSDYDLHMQLLDSNGYKLWGQAGIVVSNQPQNSAIFVYDLKTDNQGNAIVAFQDERTGPLHIVAYKIDPSGNFLWGNNGLSLIDSSSTQGLGPSIGITGENDVVIAWNSGDLNFTWIAAQRISSAGNILWNSPYRVMDTLTPKSFTNPKLVPLGNSSIQMLYVEKTGSFTGLMYVQHIDANGNNILPSPVQFSTKIVAVFFRLEPITDNKGGFYLAYDSGNPTNPSLNDVFVQHIDSAGNLWSIDGTEAANSTSNNKNYADGCISSSGEFWVLIKVLNGGQSEAGVSVQKFDSSGNVLLGPDALNIIPIDPIYYEPNTINDAENGIILTTTFGGFNSQRIIAMKLDYAGLPVWTNTVVSLCAVSSNKDDVQSGEYNGNNLVIVWQDDRTSSGIFAQNIYADGTTGLVTGLENIIAEKNIVLFPNPSSSPQIIFSELSGTDRIIILSDVHGKELGVLKINENVSSISLKEFSNLPRGIYFVTVLSSGKKEITKWIKE